MAIKGLKAKAPEGDNNIFWSEKDLKAYYQSIRESVTNINS